MPLTITAPDTHLARLRTGLHTWHRSAHVAGELLDVEMRIENGHATRYDLPRPFGDYVSAKGELITTPGMLRDLIQKYIVDLELGLAEVPVLYGDIYRTIEDANLPKDVDVAGMLAHTGVVFLERGEGEEIHFGHRERGQYATVPIRNFAAGFEWTKEVSMFDQTWRFSDLTAAIGRAHGALLNRLHLQPIIDYAYGATNITDPGRGAGDPYDPADPLWVRLWNGFYQALRDASVDVNPDTGMGRYPTLILSHSVNRLAIEQVIEGLNIMGMQPMPGFGQLQSLVLYDPVVIWEGERRYTFDGMPQDRVLLIEPKGYFVELIKQRLQVEQGEGEWTRYIDGALRADTWRGVICSPPPAVQVLMLP